MIDKISVEEGIKELPETIKFIYTESPDYKIIYANGIYGGITANRELRFDFFQEFRPFPNEEVHEVNGDGSKGKLIPEYNDLQQLKIIREKQIGVIITIDTAKALYKWLGEKLDNYADIANEREEENE